MDICKVLSGFNPVSPSEFDLSNEAIITGKLPEPALFFTWYCEKAREIEKHTGSVEFGLKLLELALESLPSNARIAKRFILATRHSLVRYNAHISSLAAKLNQDSTTEEEKASILQTLRTIDLKTFEMGAKPSVLPTEQGHELNEEDEDLTMSNSSSWNFDLEILDLILESRFDEAYTLAQQGIFFPSALVEKYSPNPVDWLRIYCKTVLQEYQNYFESLKHESLHIIPPVVCHDTWSQVVDSYLASERVSFDEEQTLSLILGKSKMAQNFLDKQKNHVPSKTDTEDVYF